MANDPVSDLRVLDSSRGTDSSLRPAVSLTYDGALPDHLSVAVFALERYQLQGTFYVNAPAVLRNIAEWKTMPSRGHEIGNGSLFGVTDEGNLLNWTLKMVEQDLHMTQEFLIDQFDEPADSFAYPGDESMCAGGDYGTIVSKMFPVARKRENGSITDMNGLYSVDVTTFTEPQFESWLRELATLPPAWTIVRFGSLRDEIAQQRHELLCMFLESKSQELWVAPLGVVANSRLRLKV